MCNIINRFANEQYILLIYYISLYVVPYLFTLTQVESMLLNSMEHMLRGKAMTASYEP